MKFQMLGSADKPGPVRLSDVYNSQVGDASMGIAASQKALYEAYNSLNSRKADSSWVTTQINNKNSFGNITLNAISSMTGDLNFRTSAASNDTPDIAWWYNNGQEKMRIFAPNEPTAKTGPSFRIYDKTGRQLYSGTLAVV